MNFLVLLIIAQPHERVQTGLHHRMTATSLPELFKPTRTFKSAVKPQLVELVLHLFQTKNVENLRT